MFSSKKKAPVQKGACGEQFASSSAHSEHAFGSGSPAPWSSRPSVIARLSSTKQNENIEGTTQLQPVYVGEFPQIVRQAQAIVHHKHFCGGIDRGTSLAWMICGSELFIWDVFSALDKHCCVLKIPPSVVDDWSNDVNKLCHTSWHVSIISWDASSAFVGQCIPEKFHSIGIVLVNRCSQAIVYWPEIGSSEVSPVISLGISGNNRFSIHNQFKSIIAASVPGSQREGIAIASESAGVLWLLEFSRTWLHRRKVSEDWNSSSVQSPYGNSAMCLSWQPCHDPSIIYERKFFVLSNQEIYCYNVSLGATKDVRRLWSHEIIGDDSELGIKRDLAGQKHIWLLDMQMDDFGKEFNILVATLFKDRISGSNYTQYSLLTMQYVINQNSKHIGENAIGSLEKKASPQTIIPKAKVEDEEFLFTMRLRYGGKPSGSVTILSGDGTATVAVQWRGCMRLYQFCLPWDAGKVLDASTCPSSGMWEGGTWIVLTEKAGVWAIPEKAVIVGGVEPPERSLSRKGSSNEAVLEDKRKQKTSGFDLRYRKSNPDANEQRTIVHGFSQGLTVDEEAETLLDRLFTEFLSSSAVENVLQKLGNGAFEREGETNIFVCMSKYIVNSLPKHWTTRNASFISSTIVSSLLEKQEKHQKFLQFLALSGCHEELSLKQRHSLLIILEHGEKLSGMIRLKELQTLLSREQSSNSGSTNVSHVQASGALVNLIQLVGEKARRSNVFLMDRENAEVFFSKVSDIGDLFYCLSNDLLCIICVETSMSVQMHGVVELVNACLTIIEAALKYREEHKDWYPSPEGLTSWNCQPSIRSGLWSVASFTMKLLKETSVMEMPLMSQLLCQLQGLADVLLDAYSSLISSKIGNCEVYNTLSQEYCGRRDELFEFIYEFAKRVAEAEYLEASKGIDNLDLKKNIYRKIISPVMSAAQRHEGHRTLWHIYVDFGDADLFNNVLHSNVGSRGEFQFYVLKQLLNRSQYAKLLRLGENLPEELEGLLKERKELLWLHKIYLNQFSSASEVLHSVAVSTSDSTIDYADPDLVRSKVIHSLSERKRLLCLAKIAAVADSNMEVDIQRIEADIQILNLQEEITQIFPDINGKINSELYSPRELIEMFLKAGRDFSVKAFEVFAWTSASFRSAHRSLLVDCWRHAADQDDWSELWQASTEEGWSDELVMESLRRTVLFNASARCYGSEAEVYDGGFEDILPLRGVNVEPGKINQLSLSVEAVLMQHKDFPDAGKLMLTAIMMGKESYAHTGHADVF